MAWKRSRVQVPYGPQNKILRGSGVFLYLLLIRDLNAGGGEAAEAGSGRLASEVCEADKRGLATVTKSLMVHKLK